MKKFLPVLSAIAMALPGMVNAATTSILFDADGALGNYAPTAIDLLDYSPGNALSIGGGAITSGETVQLLYQANLGVAKLGNQIKAASCTFNAACFTVVAGFLETATVSGGGQTATFNLAGTAGPVPSATNFFYIYAKPPGPGIQGNDLAGTNFATGMIVLSGFVSSVTTSNFNQGNQGIQDFDKFGPDNNYPGVTTITGGGVTDLNVTITSSDINYFPTLNSGGLAFSFFNTSTLTPFTTVDPSERFSSTGLVDADTLAQRGTINGVNGRDFQLLADGNQSFLAVPEPGSITLVGLALAGLGFARRRRA